MSEGAVFLRMPRVNANEDAAKVVAVHVKAGDKVVSGAPLFDIETTKATSEVAAPADCVVEEVVAALEADVPVGGRLVRLKLTGPLQDAEADLESEGAAAEAVSDGAPQISKKAELRAAELGVDIALVPATGGKVRIKDVEDFAAKQTMAPTRSRAPSLRTRYGGAHAIMVGGGGHARILLDTLRGSGWTVIGCLDKKLEPGTRVLGEVEVLGPDSMLQMLRERGVRAAFVGASGSPIDASVRKRIYESLKDLDFILPPLVHHTASLGLSSEIGEACYLMGGAQVGAQVTIGNDVIINTSATVAHDCVIGDHCHLTPNSVIAGSCRIGAGTTIGMCATVMNNVTVGQNCLVHNNAAVSKNIPDGTVVRRE
jgi:sugar O-acyltransferase (sialic acid O-acetyltransferase NeuD family)